jgi:hypothetical protein
MSGASPNWLGDEGFQAISAKHLLAEPHAVCDTMGVYMIFLRGADKILSCAGMLGTNILIPWAVSGHQHVYTGKSSGAMRSRALHHLCGTIRDSSVREFLLSMQFSERVLWASGDDTLVAMERRLTNWLVENAWVAFRACGHVSDVEEELIRRMPSPFNVTHNSKCPFHPSLKAEREKLRSHLRVTHQKHHRVSMMPSAWLVRTNHLGGVPSQSTKPLS